MSDNSRDVFMLFSPEGNAMLLPLLMTKEHRRHEDRPVSERDPWPTASCCGEPRVSRLVDACYDHAKVCHVCEGPSEMGLCHICERAA